MIPRIAVGIPLYGYVPSYVHYRHLKWFMECAAQGTIQGLLVSENVYPSWARRDIVRDALRDDFTHLFFLDQDTVVPPRCIPALLAARKPIIGALYYQKVKGHAPVAGYWKPEGDGWEPIKDVKDALMKVDVIGMGATLIETSVFRHVGPPGEWFDMNAENGEDIAFCRRAQDAGYQIWVDPRIDTEHVGSTPITRGYYAP